LPENTYRSEV